MGFKSQARVNEDFKKLAQGQLPTVAAVLYTVPADTQTIVKRIVFVNNGITDTFIRLWDGGSAAVNQILPSSKVEIDNLINHESVITMDEGATLLGEADDAATVTFTIYGVELT